MYRLIMCTLFTFRATQDLKRNHCSLGCSVMSLSKQGKISLSLITHSCTLLFPPDCIFNKLYTSTISCQSWHGFFPPVVVRVFPLGVNCPKLSEVYCAHNSVSNYQLFIVLLCAHKIYHSEFQPNFQST